MIAAPARMPPCNTTFRQLNMYFLPNLPRVGQSKQPRFGCGLRWRQRCVRVPGRDRGWGTAPGRRGGGGRLFVWGLTWGYRDSNASRVTDYSVYRFLCHSTCTLLPPWAPHTLTLGVRELFFQVRRGLGGWGLFGEGRGLGLDHT